MPLRITAESGKEALAAYAWAVAPRETRASSKTALLDAAAQLLTRFPPTEVSGRKLAREAGVNYGLVHYFGGKDRLLAEAYEELVRRFVGEVTNFGTKLPDVRRVVAREDVWRAAAYLAIDSSWSVEYRASSRPIAEAFDRLVAHRRPDADPAEREARVASVLTMLLGWAMFGPMLGRGVGLDRSADDQVLERLCSRVEEIIGGSGR
ncbi:TetR/AcrR family transcriptional regulator [Saccharopolyspora shandongensis]|uniref:TetR/AcrR family transcriptional regulator n=1 Tax=Saccharopolyspora shandongensis TaxID=418495 RepID=UPI0033C852ED